MLKNLDPNTAYESLGGKTPAERQAEMKLQKAEWKNMAGVLPKAYGVLTEDEWFSYSDRMKTFGEIEAIKWLKQRVDAAAAR